MIFLQENIMTLSDGRKLGFSVYGDKKGIPLFLFHELPVLDIWFLEDDNIAQRLGIYLIATDRPGYGLSDKKGNRKILENTHQICKESSHYLQLDNFSILGCFRGRCLCSCRFALFTKQSKIMYPCFNSYSFSPMVNLQKLCQKKIV